MSPSPGLLDKSRSGDDTVFGNTSDWLWLGLDQEAGPGSTTISMGFAKFKHEVYC